MSFKEGDHVEVVKFVGTELEIAIGSTGTVLYLSSYSGKYNIYVILDSGEHEEFNSEELKLSELGQSPLWKALK